MTSPSPVPPKRRVVDSSACVNGWKSLAICSGDMPMPVSITSMCSVLPIKPGARVLVTGPGANSMAMQSGGWTISWQGTDVTHADFPNGQTIWEAMDKAVRDAGGIATLSGDGAYKERPDVAVVVFGEHPYAEFQGDVPTLDYQPAEAKDLATLKKLKAAGIPVVALFLSGRPMWVNPEINASNAFVAAWLPGSEGGGIADVLIGDAAGKPRHDFTGRLSFSWPRTARPVTLNRGDHPYDPLFAYGYGLTYADHRPATRLSEDPGVAPGAGPAGGSAGGSRREQGVPRSAGRGRRRRRREEHRCHPSGLGVADRVDALRQRAGHLAAADQRMAAPRRVA